MESRDELVDALRRWTEAFMKRSMSGFLQFAKEQGLSMSQIGALFHISHKGTSGVSDIGDDLGVTSAAASQLLERLVQGGLIVRREDPCDRRAKQIELTERGNRIIRESMEARLRWFRALADCLSTRERELAITALRTLLTRTGELAADAVPPRRHGKEHAEK